MQEKSVDVAGVLDRIRDSQAFMGRFEEEEDDANVAEDPNEESVMAEEASRGADVALEVGKATLEVLETSVDDHGDTGDGEAANRFAPQHGRDTLYNALRGRDTFDGAEDDLVRLLCHLRMAPHGAEADIIPDALRTRKMIVNKPKRWHDLVRHQMSHADALDNLPAQRKSRMCAWVEATEKSRQKDFPALPSSLSISTGDLVAVAHLGEWHVAMCLSIWRHLKKGSGAQHCINEIPRGGVHSARVVLLEEGSSQGLYECKARSQCIILPAEQLGLRLDMPDMKRKVGIEGVKLVLPEETVLLFFEVIFFLEVMLLTRVSFGLLWDVVFKCLWALIGFEVRP